MATASSKGGAPRPKGPNILYLYMVIPRKGAKA